MPRGGYRKGAGRKSRWSTRDTSVIRVPTSLAEQLLEIAQKLDSGEKIEFVSNSKSKSVDKATKSKKRDDSVTQSKIDQLELVTESEWLTTREAWEMLGQPKKWNTFRNQKLGAFVGYGLEADPSRKVKGKIDSRWLRFSIPSNKRNL